MVQYYTLEEAAQLLHVPADQLKEMVKRNEVRAFQDRGTLRFRRQEIDELVRARGFGSDPVLQMGGPPSSGRRKKAADEGAFNVVEDAKAPKGDQPGSGSKKGGQSSGAVGKRKTAAPKTPGPRSPYPKGASDSDVRLVSDSSDLDFHLDADAPAGPKSKAPGAPKSAPRKSSPLPPPTVSDSKVPLRPDLSGDSDVKLETTGPGGSAVPIGQQGAKTPSDSDIRLEEHPAGPGSGKKRDEGLITEEIDLDAEAAKAPPRKGSKLGPAPGKPPAAPPLPTSSPFEISENDLDMGMDATEQAASERKKDSSGDFELTAPDDSSPLELGSDEVPKLPLSGADEEVTLGELTGAGAGASGINIQDPADSGISLEGSEDEIEFDLSLDAGATPKPSAKKSGPKGEEASSEFELSLPDEEGLTNKASDSDSEFELRVANDEAGAGKGVDSDSEFELTLDDEGSSELELEGSESESSSDSEFELTLDEEGGLTALDESGGAAAEEEGKDIFETDFDVPALDEESGSEAVPQDAPTDLEDSEFELDLESEGGETEEETGSEDFAVEEDEPVVSEEDEEVAPAPKRKTRMTRAHADDEDGLDVRLDDEEEDEEEVEPELAAVGSTAAAPPAEWGPLPALMLLPSVIVLIVVGLMSFEMVQAMWGFHKGSPVSRMVIDPIARMFDDTLPKE